MRLPLLSRALAGSRSALAHIGSTPTLVVFYLILAAWTALGLATLFVGMLGLLVDGLLFLLLGPAALAVCFSVARNKTRAAQVHALAAFFVAGTLAAACPTTAGPHVFFSVHGAELDGLARQLVEARCPMWIAAPSRFDLPQDPPFNVNPRAVESLRRRLGALQVLSVGHADGEVVFPIDGFADNVRGFVYVADGVRRPTPGQDFHFGMLGALVPMARPGWYFFTTT